MLEIAGGIVIAVVILVVVLPIFLLLFWPLLGLASLGWIGICIWFATQTAPDMTPVWFALPAIATLALSVHKMEKM